MQKIFQTSILFMLMQLVIFAQNGWDLIHTFNEDINSIAFRDSLNGFASSTSTNSSILRTTDGGLTWDELTILGLDAVISNISVDNDNYYIGVGDKGTIIVSTDRGNSWSVRNVGEVVNLGSSCVTKDGKLFISSTDKRVYRSTDGGNSWMSIETNSYMLTDISFSTNTIGFGVGLYGTSIKTTDGGETWLQIPSIINGSSMFAITFVNEKTGFVVGGDKIVKTTNGGISWEIKYNAGGTQLNDITTFGENIAWVVGTDKILKTSNAGESWVNQSFSPSHYLFKTVCVDPYICFALGGEGTLFKTTDGGGITFLENSDIKTPPNFEIHQNYPNPFNPTTIIKYDLVNSVNVSLKVYDVLGKEVATLVNEEKQPGSYEVEFQSVRLGRSNQQLASGIYFYQLRAGEFVQSKKMILLR